MNENNQELHNHANIYEQIRDFKNKYPLTVTWHRLYKHCEVIDKHINDDEFVLYAFTGQKNERSYDIFQTCVVAVTNKRLLIAQKRVVFGYFLKSITPDLFNDLTICQGLLWGKIIIDTVKEVVNISNLDKRCLDEIETVISKYMIKEKRKHNKPEETN